LEAGYGLGSWCFDQVNVGELPFDVKGTAYVTFLPEFENFPDLLENFVTGFIAKARWVHSLLRDMEIESPPPNRLPQRSPVSPAVDGGPGKQRVPNTAVHSLTERKPRPQFALTEHELALLAATKAVSESFAMLGGSEDQRMDYVQVLIASLKEHEDHASVRDIFSSMQHTLMAYRKDSFEEIQQEAPFSNFALQNMMQLELQWLTGGKRGFDEEWRRIFAQGWENSVAKQSPVRISGGPGVSRDTAFIVHAPDPCTRIAAEHWLSKFLFGKCSIGNRLYETYDVLDLDLSDGSSRELFFYRKLGACDRFTLSTLAFMPKGMRESQ